MEVSQTVTPGAHEPARDQPRQLAAARFETAELKDFSRTVAEIDWLLVILVLLYQVYHGTPDDNKFVIYLGVIVFSAIVVVLHYLNLFRNRGPWLLAIETWIMIAFITWVIYHTGRLDSPLFNLYLLPIVTSALTLGQKHTLLEVGLIAACYMLLGYSMDYEFFSNLTAGTFAAGLAPMLLVAYITTMLSSDILGAMAKVKLVSETDELTGIRNTRAFNSIAECEARLSARHGRTFTVLMVDADNLKQVNDTHGHEAGDMLIKHVVQCINAELRSTDVVARYGGDEFICLLRETGSHAAGLVAERIRRRVSGQPAWVGDAAVATSVSIGIATYPEHATALDLLTKNSDRALYVSKAQGRNRVTVFAQG